MSTVTKWKQKINILQLVNQKLQTTHKNYLLEYFQEERFDVIVTTAKPYCFSTKKYSQIIYIVISVLSRFSLIFLYKGPNKEAKLSFCHFKNIYLTV